MSKGYETRIDSIIEKMIDGKIEFNAKPMQQQNKDKEEIAESISNAISNLNDVGQKLVLDELDYRASQNSLEIFDSKGNIKALELTHLTATIVSSTLEDAQRKGIDLTRNSVKPEKDSTVDTILTAVMIDKKIKDYHLLSDSEKSNLIKDYSKLSDKQKDALIEGIAEELDNAIELTNDPITKENLAEQKECIEIARNVEKNVAEIPDEEKKRLYEMYSKRLPNDIKAKFEAELQEEKIGTLSAEELYDIFVTFIVKIDGDLGQSFSNIIKNKGEIPPKQWETMNQLNSLIKDLGSEVKEYNIDKIQQLEKNVAEREQIMIEENDSSNNEFIFGNAEMIASDEVEESPREEMKGQSLKDMLAQKPISIMAALFKINIPEKDIRESLQIYKDVFEKIDKNDIEKLKKSFGKPKFSDKLNKKFKQFGMDERISEILSKIDYEGQLLDILGNEKQREMFLNGLENAVHIEIEPDKIEIDGEIEALDLYFEENTVDLEVAESTTLTEKAGEELGEENPAWFEKVPQEPVTDMDVDFGNDIFGLEPEEESSRSISEEEEYTGTLAAEEMEVEQPQVFDMAALFDAQIAKNIFAENGSKEELGQTIDFLNTLGKEMANPDKMQSEEREDKSTSLEDSDEDNR